MEEEIKKFFKGDLDDSEATLVKYSHDASLLEVRPKLVLFPKSSQDVQNVVKWAGENKEKYPDLYLTSRCAGTDMGGGAVGESIILDFTRYMNKLIGGPLPLETHKEWSITVEPGMYYRDFEKITLSKGLILPCFTASKSLNAMGGMFGNNSGGERTLRFGKTEEYILSAKVVLADGKEYEIKPLNERELRAKMAQNDFEGAVYKNIYNLIEKNEDDIRAAKPQVHKNSAGYYLWNVFRPEGTFDLNRLLVGSQGTLGIATEITFKLLPEPKHTRLLVVFLRDMGILPKLVNKILDFKPQSLESYDDKTFLLVLKYIWSFAKLLGFGNFFKLIWSFWPEAIMTLRHGLPRLALLVEFTGDTEGEADRKAEQALAALRKEKNIGVRLTRSAFEAEKYWTIRREAFNLIRYHLKKRKSKPFVDDVIVRPEFLPKFFPELYKILNEYKSEMTFAIGGHSGDGNMHIYTLVDMKDPNLKKMIMAVADRVYDLVLRCHGSITAEHNDGLIRTPYLGKMYGERVTALFKETKQIFDPKDILNIGKKVPDPIHGGTKAYIEAHISR